MELCGLEMNIWWLSMSTRNFGSNDMISSHMSTWMQHDGEMGWSDSAQQPYEILEWNINSSIRHEMLAFLRDTNRRHTHLRLGKLCRARSCLIWRSKKQRRQHQDDANFGTTNTLKMNKRLIIHSIDSKTVPSFKRSWGSAVAYARLLVSSEG